MREKYESLSLVVLRDLAKARGLKNISSMKKSDLVNRMLEEALPPYISAAIVPGELHEISFPDDATGDVTKVEKATKEILNTAGGAQILNLNSASNSTAFTYGVLADSTFSISTLIPQIQAIVNRLLSSWISEPCKVKFFDVSIYQKDDFKKSILESCQNGLPNKILYNTLNGVSEKDTLAMNFLEEDCLNLGEKLKPFKIGRASCRERV